MYHGLNQALLWTKQKGWEDINGIVRQFLWANHKHLYKHYCLSSLGISFLGTWVSSSLGFAFSAALKEHQLKVILLSTIWIPQDKCPNRSIANRSLNLNEEMGEKSAVLEKQLQSSHRYVKTQNQHSMCPVTIAGSKLLLNWLKQVTGWVKIHY